MKKSALGVAVERGRLLASSQPTAERSNDHRNRSMITVGTPLSGYRFRSRLIAESRQKNGVMATVNERIDFDTAQIIVEELGTGSDAGPPGHG